MDNLFCAETDTGTNAILLNDKVKIYRHYPLRDAWIILIPTPVLHFKLVLDNDPLIFATEQAAQTVIDRDFPNKGYYASRYLTFEEKLLTLEDVQKRTWKGKKPSKPKILKREAG